MRKKIKIPVGDIHVIFEKNGQGFEITDKMLWEALCDYAFKETSEKESTVFGYRNPQLTNEKVYDDENPDYIRNTEDGI